MTTKTVRSFPFSGAPGLDLEPEYEALQRVEPVSRVRLPYGEESWLVTRHHDVRLVLSDPRFSRAATLERDVPRVTEDNFVGGLIALDPPEHTRVRSIAGRAFTPRSVARLRDRAEAIADELVDEILDSSVIDAVEDFSVPFTLKLICEILGVPYSDRHQFRSWSDAGLGTTALSMEERLAAAGHMWEYMSNLVNTRRQTPTDDLLSVMVQARDETNAVTNDELVTVGLTILGAGYETTATELSNFIYLLLEDRSRFEELIHNPAAVPSAVEELIRFSPLEANGSSPRYATEDIDLGDQLISKGDPVIAATVIANRDPQVFVDGHRLDFDRNPNPHLGFGLGPHFCLGAQLARLELEVALRTLIKRMPGLCLAGPPVSWKSGMLVRGPAKLPVAKASVDLWQ